MSESDRDSQPVIQKAVNRPSINIRSTSSFEELGWYIIDLQPYIIDLERRIAALEAKAGDAK